MKKETCHICGDSFYRILSHLKKHKNKENNNYDKIKFDFLLKNYRIIADKTKLENEYIKQRKSVLSISGEFNINYKHITFLLDYFNIKKRGISEQRILNIDKYTKSLKSKYGVTNISQIEEVKEKKKRTFLKHYGVDNIRKSKEFNDWLTEYMVEKYGKKRITNAVKISKARKNFSDDKWTDIHDKYKKTSLEKYGVENASSRKDYKDRHSILMKERWKNLTDEQKNNILKNLKGVKYRTKIESKIQEVLNNLGISYQCQRFIGQKSFDFVVDKTIIEVNGDYWHANPSIYKSDDIISYPFGKIEAKEIWKKDKSKKRLAERYGYRVIYIWEKEINKTKNLEKLLLNKLKLNKLN